jgi:CO dehydrogenase/acetyl-CoA synthase beta subunit
MLYTENLIRATDFIVFLKGIRREWIAYPESGKIFSTVTGEFLKTKKLSGYHVLSISQRYAGKRYSTTIPFHRAIWILSRGIPLSLRAEVDHIDGDKENNCIGNLRLISKEENTPHKLNFETAEEIRRRYAEGETQRELAKAYGAGKSTISDIIRCETHKRQPEKMHYRGRV